MVALQSIFVASFSSIFLLGSINMNGSEGLHSEDDISPNPTYSTGSSKLDSPPKTKTRLSLCCSFGVDRKYGSCLTDETMTDKVPRKATRINGLVSGKEVSKQNFDLVIDDPCDFDWMVPSLLYNFSVLENGSISDEDSSAETLYDLEHYCLFRNPETVDYLARVCDPLLRMSSWECFCAIALMVIMLAIFIVYSVIPESKNLHGMMFRAYTGTYIGIGITCLAAELTTESRTNAYLYSLSDNSARFCAMSCGCWLNAMSFNIWRSIRRLQRIDSHTRESERRKFICYAVHAWGTPVIILTAILCPLYYFPHLGHETSGYNLKLWGCVASVAVIYTSNAIFSVWTVLAIRHHKKETACVVNSVNRHNDIDLEWFNLCVKLFVFMGGHLVMWIIWLLKPTQTIVHILGTLEVIQAVLIFVIFVWKENIKRSFRERLLEVLTRGPNNSS